MRVLAFFCEEAGFEDCAVYKEHIVQSLILTDFYSDDESEKKTLSESAAEYTESHTNKRKYDVVDVVTGNKIRICLRQS